MRILWVTALTLVVDQLAKFAVVKLMYPGQSLPVLGDWLRLTYTTNPGMAFGISFGPPGLVTVLSLLATMLIVGYLFTIKGGYKPYLASLALILGGALGNIIDRVFYGVIYNHGGLFTGEVVDFIHVNIWRGYVPSGFPLLGGSYVALFPIWNVADMAIVIGVVGILVFQNRFHELRARTISMAGAPGPASSTLPEPGNLEGFSLGSPADSEGSAVAYTTPGGESEQ
ncbi:MAG TPA: signal peptidase II [Rhodothermales bacterium]|nr:signal peptidase II [Rhodothermales bacterium]